MILRCQIKELWNTHTFELHLSEKDYKQVKKRLSDLWEVKK